MGELIFILLFVSTLCSVIGGVVAFGYVSDASYSKELWRKNSHWLWKGTLAGFFWPIGIVLMGRILWKDFWESLPEK